MLEACKTVSLVERARLRSLVVGGKSGSRDVVYSDSNRWIVGKTPAVSGGREKTQREELQCQVESDTVVDRL